MIGLLRHSASIWSGAKRKAAFPIQYKTVLDAFTSKPNNYVQNSQANLVRLLVRYGIWDKLDLFYVFAGHTNDNGESLINWINPGTFDAVNTNAAFTQLEGFKGNGTDAYIDTGFVPSTHASKLKLNDLAFGAHNLESLTGTTTENLLSTYDGDNESYMLIQPQLDITGLKSRAAVGGITWLPQSDFVNPIGLFTASRLNDKSYLYRNNYPIAQDFSGIQQVSLSDKSLLFLAARGSTSGNTIFGFSNAKISCTFLGLHLNEVELQLINLAIQNYLESINAIDSDFIDNADNVIAVKKDGTGDFTNIPDAINSIADATFSNTYRIDIYDDFTVTDLSDYTFADGSYRRFIDLPDYVYLNGIGAINIDCSLPETITDSQSSFYENIACNAYSGAKNITFTQKNGRYTLHIDSSVGIDKLQFFKYCNFIHYGNQEIIDYRIANSQSYSGVAPGLNALGSGSHSGQVMYFDNCTFQSIKPIGFHTNINFSKQSYLILLDSTIQSMPYVNTTYNPSGDILDSIILDCLNSTIDNYVIINNCSINNDIYYSGRYYNNSNTDIYLLDDIKISIYSTTYTFVNEFTDGGSLFIQSSTNGSVAITGDAESVIMPDSEAFNLGALGQLEVGEWSGNTNVKLGVRLGDCSVVNKTLSVLVDGTESIDIVFNENFTAQTNAYVLAFINSSLSTFATASLYQRAKDYVPIEY